MPRSSYSAKMASLFHDAASYRSSPATYRPSPASPWSPLVYEDHLHSARAIQLHSPSSHGPGVTPALSWPELRSASEEPDSPSRTHNAGHTPPYQGTPPSSIFRSDAFGALDRTVLPTSPRGTPFDDAESRLPSRIRYAGNTPPYGHTPPYPTVESNHLNDLKLDRSNLQSASGLPSGTERLVESASSDSWTGDDEFFPQARRRHQPTLSHSMGERSDAPPPTSPSPLDEPPAQQRRMNPASALTFRPRSSRFQAVRFPLPLSKRSRSESSEEAVESE